MQLILYVCLTGLFLSEATKICANCKHHIKNVMTINPSYKCALFEKAEDIYDVREREKNHLQYLITGIKIDRPDKPKDYFFCETARGFDSMCGLEGNKFEPFPH